MVDWKHEIGQRLSGLNLDPRREAEIVEELSQHLDDRYAELPKVRFPLNEVVTRI